MSWRRALLVLLVVLPVCSRRPGGGRHVRARARSSSGARVEHALDGRIAAAGRGRQPGLRTRDSRVPLLGQGRNGRDLAIRRAHWHRLLAAGDPRRGCGGPGDSVEVRKKPSSGPRPSLEERLAALVLVRITRRRSRSARPARVARSRIARHRHRTGVARRRLDRPCRDRTGHGRDRQAPAGCERHTRTARQRTFGRRTRIPAGPASAPDDSIDATAGIDGDLRGFAYTARVEIGMQQLGPLGAVGGGPGWIRRGPDRERHGRRRGAGRGGTGGNPLAGRIPCRSRRELETLALARFLDAWPKAIPWAAASSSATPRPNSRSTRLCSSSPARTPKWPAASRSTRTAGRWRRTWTGTSFAGRSIQRCHGSRATRAAGAFGQHRQLAGRRDTRVRKPGVAAGTLQCRGRRRP